MSDLLTVNLSTSGKCCQTCTIYIMLYALGFEVDIRMREYRFGLNKKSYASAKKKHEYVT